MDSSTPQYASHGLRNFLSIQRQFMIEHYVSTLYLRGGGKDKDKKKNKKGSQAVLDPNAQPPPSFQPSPNPSFQPPPFQPIPLQTPPNHPPFNQPPSNKPPAMLSRPIINTPRASPYNQKPNPNPSKALLSVHSNLQNIQFLPPGYPNAAGSQNTSQTPAQLSQPAQLASVTPTVYPNHPGLFTKLKVAVKLRDKEHPDRPASWRSGSPKEHNGVYGYARAKKPNKKGKKVAVGPVGLAINKKKLTHDLVQDKGEQLPGREVEFHGKFRREYGKEFWYVPLAREEDSD